MWIVNLLTAAPLRGYRTQVLGGVAFIGALASWLVGDMTLVELIQILPEMAIGLGLTALGAKQNTVAKNQGVSVK